MKTLAEIYQVNQEIEVIIKEPKIGKFPRASVVGQNVVCLFERLPKPRFFEIGSIWKVRITTIKAKNLEIYPIEQIKSKAENESEVSDKLEGLVSKFNK